MNDRVNESFSAFLDGEASEVDIQRMLKALDKDPGLLDEWQRLSRTQATLAGDVLVDVPIGTEADGIGTEHMADTAPTRWRLRLGQGALAAAVALVVVATAHWPFGTFPAGSELRVADGAPMEAAQTRFEIQQRLKSYLRQHAEAASYSSGHVVVPYQLSWEARE